QVVNEFALLDEKANQARRAAAPLRKDPEVQRELRARDRHAQLTNGLRQATPPQAEEVRAFARQLVADFHGTPTAEKVQAWLDTNG
ncbi:MAG: hypothetical protein AAF656_13455, partial [Planctomycetota bacterium]